MSKQLFIFVQTNFYRHVVDFLLGTVQTQNHSAQRLCYMCITALLTLMSGCMLEPADGKSVNSTSTPITFAGYTDQSSETVVIEYAVGATWRELTRTGTASSVSLTESGTDFFSWSSSQTLPPEAWNAGTTGSFAKVRSHVTRSGNHHNLTSFRTDWSSCWGSNPNVGQFISNCSSDNSPWAYIYTRNYPAGVDLQLTALRWTSVGRTEAVVRNGGRHGLVTRLECNRFGSASAMTITDEIAPGETRTYRSAVAPAGRVTCTVMGMNMDGSPEANVANNTFTRTF